jgi:ABC-2 type transport system ATP-binding protein
VAEESEETEEPEEVAPPASAGPTIVKIETLNSRDALVNVITFLNERDVTLHSMEILESNLENVFLHLTGKKLRE